MLLAPTLGGCGLVSEAVAAQACPDRVVLSARTPVVTGTFTSNEPAGALPPTAVVRFTELGGTGDGCVDVLDPDGALTGYSVAPRRPDGELDEGSYAQRVVDDNVAAVSAAVARLAAHEPELDPVRAIALAARRHPEPTDLYVLTSGLSSVPTLDLNRADWNAGGRHVGAWLVTQNLLPDLTGWRVHLVGLGDVAGAQPEIGDPARVRLRLLWLDICAATHATCTAEPGPLRPLPPISANRVTPVRPPKPPTYPAAVRLPGPALFSRDSADLGPGADAALAEVADLARRAGTGIQIIGRTDAISGSAAHNLDLSRRRAETVRDRLVALGLPSSAIVSVEGVGSRDADPEKERRDPRQVDRDRNVEIRFVALPAAGGSAGPARQP